MELVVDLHIHSNYSRATSKDSTLEGLYYWGKLKGINVIGTGDFTHPKWFAELREKLVIDDTGLFALREDLAQEVDARLPETVRSNPIRFIPTVEISTIYKKLDQVRKIHQLIVAPTFEVVSEINAKLDRIGNLKSDGRPILGLDSKELLRIVIQTDPSALYIPAHIWTPWFAMFGSKSGFNTIVDCFEELTPNIYAIETGLSSDPYMNWQLDQLQNITITSHSDAHSPQKLGREATVVDASLTYDDVIGAIKTNDQRLIGTIEFFPQEGKYHYDGHRTCGVRFTPEQSKKHNGICPVCGKPLTIGVDYRVQELADRPQVSGLAGKQVRRQRSDSPTNSSSHQPANPHGKSVEYIIPMVEIIAELKKAGPSSKGVIEYYHKALATLTDEFTLLRKTPIAVIQAAGFPELAYGIDRMRKGDVHIEPGYDGVFGVIKLFADDDERKKVGGQLGLFWSKDKRA